MKPEAIVRGWNQIYIPHPFPGRLCIHHTHLHSFSALHTLTFLSLLITISLTPTSTVQHPYPISSAVVTSQASTMSRRNLTDSRSQNTPPPLSQQNHMCTHHNPKRIPPSMVGIDPKARYVWFRGRKVKRARSWLVKNFRISLERGKWVLSDLCHEYNCSEIWLWYCWLSQRHKS